MPSVEPASVGVASTEGQTDAATALMYVQMNPPAGGEDAFNGWYDNHAAARLGMPGILTASRYEAAEPEGARYLATYDLADVSALQSPEYLQLRQDEADRDRDMRASIPLIDRRVYRALDVGRPWTAPWTDHAPYLLSVAMEPPPEMVEDYHAWYLEEHIPMLLKVKGWRRIRRYELVQGNATRFMALHELDSLAGFGGAEHTASISTPWRLRVAAYITKRERGLFKLRRGF
jgi:hypothetical protein